ncbi:amidohydrolase family-domain-containing protein [Plectosphaerella plurivora]|uniref:Amidohydrolase family-domain-containing protein n=1 Tax=Plectosphaerella plurivora TaxID=936078 RepID=A0A9P8VMW4_9PEZI|nr:amidohydrolase family-domain-containing protein [Plectosphaerella plurivora]
MVALIVGAILTPQTADIVFQNGSMYTLDARSSKASSLAIRNGSILYVGNDANARRFIGRNTRVINLEGRMAMPGLVDVHMHILQAGQNLIKCNFNYQPLNPQQVLEHLQTCIDADGGDQDAWLDAVNLNYLALAAGGETLSKLDLDTLNTTRPMSLRSTDYHSFVLNTRALELSNITGTTPARPGGIIELLPGTQEPSGMLLDGANILIAGPPAYTNEENAEACRAASQALRQAGITTWQDALATNEHYSPWEILQERDELSARGYFDYRVQPTSTLEAVDAVVAETIELITSRNDNSTIGPRPAFKWQAIKALLDGIPIYSARTAAPVDPYWLPTTDANGTQVWAPAPEENAELYWDPEILAKTLEGLFLAGIDAQLHTTGDRAVHVSLDAVEAYKNAHPNAPPIRLALAHADLTLEEDWPRFAELGVDTVFSYQWSQLSPMWTETLQSFGEYRLDNLAAYARIEEAGRAPVYGSDWPTQVDPLDVWLALKTGVTRRGDPLNPNSAASANPAFYETAFPGVGISRESALRATTVNGARWLRADKQIGSLEVGKVADIIVLERNYFEVPEEELGRNRVLLTMVGGEVVYLEDGAQATFGQNVTAKFPNDNGVAVKMARMVVGGIDGTELDFEARTEVARLRKRQSGCGHEH